MTKFTFSLDNPTYLLPHKVGILGLAKVLDYCDRMNELIPFDIDFGINQRDLTISWQCHDIEAFSILINAAYQIKDGMIDSPAMELSEEERYFFSQGLLSSFFQHNMHRKFTGENKELSFLIDKEKPPLTPSIRLVSECCYTTNIPKLFSKNGAFMPEMFIKSHNFPGMIEDETNPKKNLEPVEKFLLLLFLPLVAPVVSLSHDSLGARKGLILIEPHDLIAQSKDKIPRGFKHSIYSSSGDALLSSLANSTGNIHELDKELYVLGTQQWNAKQRFIKKKVVRPKITDESLYLFRSFAELLPNQLNLSQKEIKKDNGDSVQKAFISTSSLLGFVSDNLVDGKPWHNDLGQYLLPKPYYERDTLLSMTQEYGSSDYKELMNFGRSLWEGYIKSKGVTAYSPYYKSLRTRAIYLLQSAKNKDAFLRNFSSLFPDGIDQLLSLETGWETIRDEILQSIFLYNLPKLDKTETGSNDKEQ